MVTRRTLLRVSVAAVATFAVSPVQAHKKTVKIDSKFEPQIVKFSGYAPGTIVIDVSRHFLYFQLRGRRARRYGIGVGRAGLAFKGQATIARKAKWPSWTPTKNMIRREPGKYAKYANGVPGGPKNPLGSRALYLYKGGRDTLYRIHGTTQPSSIGRSVSNGCIRMLNAHVEDLYRRVPIGAQVIVR